MSFFILLCNFLKRMMKIWGTQWSSSSHPISRLRGNKGVLIVEYVLLLLCCVAIAAVVQKAFDIGADEQSSGWIINQWIKMLRVIAEDV